MGMGKSGFREKNENLGGHFSFKSKKQKNKTQNKMGVGENSASYLGHGSGNGEKPVHFKDGRIW